MAQTLTAAPPRRHDVADLVGRAVELQLLRDAASAPPVLVTLEGEAGIGKTRLLRELLRQPLGSRAVLVGRCQQLREPFPLGAVVDAIHGADGHLRTARLSALAGALRPLLPELATVLPPAPPPLGDARAERHRTVRALHELLSALGPSILVVEDAHWADEQTEEFLSYLLQRPPRHLAVVVSFRDPDLRADSLLRPLLLRPPPELAVVRIPLRPLGAAAVRDMASSILDTDVSAEFGDYLHERTGGVPFAVEELVRLLQDRRDLVCKDGRWIRRELAELPVPAGYRETVLERLLRLPEPARQLLQACAVLAVAAPHDVLCQVADLPADRAGRAYGVALASGLVEDTAQGLAFRHVLARDAIYGAIAAPDRVLLHRRAAEALTAVELPPLAQLARHWRAAGDVARWLASAEAAAETAALRGDDATAAELLAPALSADAPLRHRARLAARFAEAALHGRAHVAAARSLRALVESEGLRRGERGELRFMLGRLLVESGDANAGLREIRAAVDELEERPELCARAMVYLGYPWLGAASADEHAAWMDRASATASRSGDPLAVTVTMVDRATLLSCVGDARAAAAADALPATASTVAEQRELARAMLNLSLSWHFLGHYRRARSCIARGDEIATELQYERSRTGLRCADALLRWSTGEWDGLRESLRELADRTEGIPGDAAQNQLVLALLTMARSGRDADPALQDLAAFFEERGDVALLALASGARARLAAAEGEHALAAAEASRPLRFVERKDVWVWAAPVAAPLTAALLAGGDTGSAARFVDRLEHGLRGRDAPYAAAALSLSRGMLAACGASPDGTHHLRAAQAAFDSLPAPYDAAHACEALGLSLTTSGDPSGPAALREALRRYDALDARWDAARCRASLRANGIRLPHRGGRRGYGSSLSPREREVAALAADGKTNRVIAESLFLSVKTVEKHVSNAMRKLEVDSRQALAAAVGSAEPV